MSRNAQAPGQSMAIGTGGSRLRPARRWAIALLLCAAMPAPVVAAPSAEEQAAITQINVRRGQVFLPPLTPNSSLETAARGHAAYLATNNTTGHFQTSTAPGFTGVTPFDRIFATYGTNAASNEVISFSPTTGAAAIDSLIQAIYHRFGLFSSRVEDTGVGNVTNHPTYGSVFVVNSAVQFVPPPAQGTWIGVYPYSGQGAGGQDPVPHSFYSDTESPDPVPGGNKVGYPISIHVDDDKQLVVTTFTVKPVGGSPLAAQLLAPNDPSVPKSAAALIPTAPLAYGTTYEAQFTGTAAGSIPVTRTWQFTTAPFQAIAFSPAQPYLGYSSTLDIGVSGGSGVYTGATYSGPATVAFAGPSTLRVTSQTSSGSVMINVTDDEGNQGLVVVEVQPTADSTPDAFPFPAVTGAAVSTQVTSAPITVSGINVPAGIGISLGGEYSINGGAFTSQPGTVVNSNTVRVRLTSSPIGSTTTSATLTIGGVGAMFSVTTVDNSVPSVPTGLAISNLGGNSLTVSWSASGDDIGVTAYRVFRGGVFRATVNAPTTSFGDTGLAAATLYSYTVSACDAAGNCSAQSVSVSATTLDNVPPGAPTGLGITNLAATTLTLNWLASTDNVGVTAYRVLRDGVFRATVTAPTLTFNDTGLASGTLYSYTVAACDLANNCSVPSTAVSATTLDNVAPSTPAGLGITNLAANTLTLNWLASTDNVAVTAYRVLRDGVFRATVNAPAVSFNDSGLAAVTLYSYAVAACDAAGNCSAPSGTISATTLDNIPPSVPGSLTATAFSGTQINLAWSAASDNVAVTAYAVYRGGVFRASVNAPATAYSDTGVSSAVTYSYTVRACDAAGNCSAPSAAASATTPDILAPSTPGGVAAVTAGQSRINVTWNAATDNVAVTAYAVYRGGAFLITVNAPALGLSDTGLAGSTTYTYTVRACDAAGNCSPQSAASSATTLAPGQYVSAPVLEPTFNLISNALNTTLDVAVMFGNQDPGNQVAGITENVLSVWKWNALDQRWAFYSPQLTTAGNVSYAAGKNYDVLSIVNPGEGYWVNSQNPIALQPQAGSGFNWDATSFAALPSGFNLITAADTFTPTQFNANVSPVPPAPGVVPIDNFLSLWAWDAVAGKWYFYSPLLEASPGGLQAVKDYADTHFYLHFQDYNKSLGVGVGFWVNKP